MNEELFNEASKSNILSKQLVDQLQESMTYSSISFINWTIEVLKLLKARIERGDKIKDETTGVIYDLYTFRQFVENNFATGIVYIKDTRTDTSQPFISENGKYCKYNKDLGKLTEL